MNGRYHQHLSATLVLWNPQNNTSYYLARFLKARVPKYEEANLVMNAVLYVK
jgi:hypothetical protein